MRIPRYWARAEGTTPPDYEGDRRIVIWGWSEKSRALAERHAHERLTHVLDRLRQGRGFPKGYAYGTRALREEILEELRGRGGTVDALLTRNSYGSVGSTQKSQEHQYPRDRRGGRRFTRRIVIRSSNRRESLRP